MIMLKTYFKKRATVKNIILFFILSLLVNLLFTLFSGALEYEIPDTHFYYTPKDFYALMGKFSRENIDIYIKSILLLDFIYPVFYSLFLAFFIFSLSQKTLLSLLPFGILIFDYLENLSVLTLIMLMPSQYNILATFSGYSTMIKWILTGICLIIIFVYIVFYFTKIKFGQNK